MGDFDEELRVNVCCFTPTSEADAADPIWDVELWGGLWLSRYPVGEISGDPSDSKTLSVVLTRAHLIYLTGLPLHVFSYAGVGLANKTP